MKEISILDIEGIRIGQTEDSQAGTGCTAFICERGMAAGLDIRGGGPASRDTHLLDPLTAAQQIHAVVLAGGSAFGLSAGGGVMKYLEEHDIGYDVGVTKVPLVVQSDLFDLTVGDKAVRPDAAMGYEAARLAMESPNYKDGNYGAGCGATVGKFNGMETCMKTGIGSYAVQIGDFKMGAVVALNALGDIYDWKTGKKVAGLLVEDGGSFRDTVELMKGRLAVVENKFAAAAEHDDAPDQVIATVSEDKAVSGNGTGESVDAPDQVIATVSGDNGVTNTTLCVVITNAAFTKTQLCKIASMAHNGYARSIRPVHTSADGDSIYAVSVGDLPVDHDLAGTLAADVVSEAILRAVSSAESCYGFPAAKDLKF